MIAECQALIAAVDRAEEADVLNKELSEDDWTIVEAMTKAFKAVERRMHSDGIIDTRYREVMPTAPFEMPESQINALSAKEVKAALTWYHRFARANALNSNGWDNWINGNLRGVLRRYIAVFGGA